MKFYSFLNKVKQVKKYLILFPLLFLFQGCIGPSKEEVLVQKQQEAEKMKQQAEAKKKKSC